MHVVVLFRKIAINLFWMVSVIAVIPKLCIRANKYYSNASYFNGTMAFVVDSYSEEIHNNFLS